MSFKLHADNNFHYETLRSLGTVRYYGADVMEQLNLMPKIKVNDFDSWYDEWSGLAKQVLSTIDENNLQSYDPVTIRNVYFRASHYYWMSEFFLHINWDDERSADAFQKWRKYFDIANSYLEIPGEHVGVKASFGTIPCILYRTPKASKENPRPTVICTGGFDNNMEELLHDFGFDLLERGYNVLIYDGPGQPSFLRGDQRLGFRYDWEKVVTPIVDYLEKVDYVEQSKIGLLGMSFGGYLVARAAAFESRLAAVMCIDGVWSFFDCCMNAMKELQPAWDAQDETAFDKEFDKNGLKSANSNRRWIHDHLKIALREKSAFKCFKILETMTLDGVAEKIKMPAFIGDAAADIFFLGQPPKVAAAIENSTLYHFDDQNAAAAHCASGALTFQNQVIWEWFARAIGERS